MQQEAHNYAGTPDHHGGSSRQYVIGYLLSIVLTIAALVLTITHVLPFGALLTVILLLGVLQIVVQLFFFMHITEGKGPHYHVYALAVGLFFTAAIIGISIWIMSFNSMVA